MKYLLILFTFILVSSVSNAQTSGFELYEKVMNELPHTELDRLEPVKELIETGENLMQESDKMEQDIARIHVKYTHVDQKQQRKYDKRIKKLKEKSLENIVLASQKFTTADTLLYTVFKENIDKVENTKNKQRSLLAKLLIKEAEKHYNTALTLNSYISEDISKKDLLLRINEIKKLENSAITKIAYAYGVYLRWSDILLIFEEELRRVDESYEFTADIIEADSLECDSEITFSALKYIKNKPISNEELQRLKKKYPKIYIHLDGIWIYYALGCYKSYFDAVQAIGKNEKMYVVAYKNNFPIKIEKALNETSVR